MPCECICLLSFEPRCLLELRGELIGVKGS